MPEAARDCDQSSHKETDSLRSQSHVAECQGEVQLAKKATEAEKRATYQLGVEEMQVRLIEELSEVYKDYCSVMWDKALNVPGVPTDSVWRLPGSVFYPLEIREVPIDAPESSEQPIAIPDAIPLTETTKGSSQAGNQG